MRPGSPPRPLEIAAREGRASAMTTATLVVPMPRATRLQPSSATALASAERPAASSTAMADERRRGHRRHHGHHGARRERVLLAAARPPFRSATCQRAVRGACIGRLRVDGGEIVSPKLARLVQLLRRAFRGEQQRRPPTNLKVDQWSVRRLRMKSCAQHLDGPISPKAGGASGRALCIGGRRLSSERRRAFAGSRDRP